MFAPEDALREFEAFLASRGLAAAMLGVENGCAAVFDFYREVRAKGCTQVPDADMLLYQWGTYDWGEGEHFQLDLTRQLIPSEEAEDEDIWQLSLTFLFAPAADLEAVGAGNEWCPSVRALPRFEAHVRGSAAFKAGVARKIVRTTLSYECAG
jgi:hypothetical protein